MSKKVVSQNLKPSDIKTGDHKYDITRKVSREYKPLNAAENRFRKETGDELDRMNNVPDYDSGYVYIEINGAGYGDYSEVTLKHNLGRIPSSISMFYCDVEEPKYGKDIVYAFVPSQWLAYGVQVKYTDKNTMVLVCGVGNNADLFNATGANYGYIRILLWR